MEDDQQKPGTPVNGAPQPDMSGDEVYIPAEDTREKRRARAEAHRTASLEKKRGPFAAARRRSAAAKKREAEKQDRARQKADRYVPYQKANDARKQQRSASVRGKLQTFFSNRNPLLRVIYKEDPNVFGEEEASERQARRAAEAERKRKIAERLNTPAVIYTKPTAFHAGRLVVQLLTVLAVVLAVVLGMSVFFKVKVITVSGANVYSAWTVREQSGISEGDSLLTFSRTRASGQIIANLPYVRSARIGIKLPDTVNIEIVEEDVVYSIQADDGLWWLINSAGKVVESTTTTAAKNYTQVLGVTISEPEAGETGVATEAAQLETTAEGETVQALITGAQRLNCALQILQALEANDIVGDAASVDVSQLQDIILWYGTRYQVNLGSIDRIDYKIAYMKSAIMQMSDYQSGILDVSFTTWTDTAGFTPFA